MNAGHRNWVRGCLLSYLLAVEASRQALPAARVNVERERRRLWRKIEILKKREGHLAAARGAVLSAPSAMGAGAGEVPPDRVALHAIAGELRPICRERRWLAEQIRELFAICEADGPEAQVERRKRIAQIKRAEWDARTNL